jgi:hypothetical protein
VLPLRVSNVRTESTVTVLSIERNVPALSGDDA